jgi:Peptidase family M28
MRASLWIWLLLLAASLSGCRAPATPDGAMPPIPAAATDFSGDAALAHLRALAAIGPRAAGTPGADQARAYLRTQIENLGLRVEERRYFGPPGPDGVRPELVNLEAVVPGASPQLFVLTAAYDTRPFESFRFQGANDGASAPALLLELMRVIVARPLPYTTRFVFVDREAAGASDPSGTPLLIGSQLLAADLMSDKERAASVRLVVSFQQVGDAELRIARDLRSHRLFREEFWLAAARLGRTDAFRPADRFESPVGSQTSFLSAGFRGVVLITDSSYGGDEPPGAWANSEDDTPERCSAQSLATVGVVTLEALDRIGQRLAKIDRFATKQAGEPAAAPPEPAPAAEPPSEPPPAPPTPAPSAPTLEPEPAPPPPTP